MQGNSLDHSLQQDEKLMMEIRNWIFSLSRKVWELKAHNMELTMVINLNNLKEHSRIPSIFISE